MNISLTHGEKQFQETRCTPGFGWHMPGLKFLLLQDFYLPDSLLDQKLTYVVPKLLCIIIAFSLSGDKGYFC